MGREKTGTRIILGTFAASCLILCVLLLGCTDDASIEQVRRGGIATADGVVLAESVESGDGYKRVYSESSLAGEIVARLERDDLDDSYAINPKALLDSGQDLTLTMDSSL